MTELHAVTALYDIGRAERGDGRGIEQYLRWLNRTLRLPVPFTVYLDPGIDPARVALKPGDTIVPLPWDALATAKWLPQVEEICRNAERFPGRADLTYRLPRYILTTMAKFDLMAKVAAQTSANAVLWVDAGAGRFSPWDMAKLRLREDALGRFLAAAPLTIHARHQLRDCLERGARPSFAGRCFPLTAGAAILVRKDAAARLRDLVFDHVEQNWLPHGLWDTEQTALGEVILARRIDVAIQEESGRDIRLLGALFEPTEPLPFGQRWNRTRKFWRAPLPLRLLMFARWDFYSWWRRLRHGGPGGDIAAIYGAEPQ